MSSDDAAEDGAGAGPAGAWAGAADAAPGPPGSPGGPVRRGDAEDAALDEIDDDGRGRDAGPRTDGAGPVFSRGRSS